MRFQLALLYFLNLADGLLTFLLVGSATEELNPIARVALTAGPLAFFLFKFAALVAPVGVLYRYRQRFLVQASVPVVLAIYAALVGSELTMLVMRG